MKKTLAVAAVLAAFAGSAMADVTVYGKVDAGLGYVNKDGDSSWQMKSGGAGASRLGFKGSEKIGDMTVGFLYETGLTMDDGRTNVAAEEDKKDRMWTRASQLYVKGAYGELGFGYYGVLESATGPYDVAAGLSAMGTGYFGIGDHSYVMNYRGGKRVENGVTYKSPAFAGVTVTAQVGTLDADATYEYSDESDMYYGVAAKYAAGDFGAGLIVSKVMAKDSGDEDLNVTVGVNYNFGVAKAFLAANYYAADNDQDEQGFVVGVQMPLMGGSLEAQAGYGEKDSGTDTTFAGAFYKYPLSKQTFLYGAAGWDQTKTVAETKDNYRAIFGMQHNF